MSELGKEGREGGRQVGRKRLAPERRWETWRASQGHCGALCQVGSSGEKWPGHRSSYRVVRVEGKVCVKVCLQNVMSLPV